MRNHRQVVRVDLDDRGAHALREKALRVWRNGLISLSNEVPRRNGLPSRLAHRLPECARGERLLHRKHDFRVDRINVTREVIEEIVLRQPCVALLVDIEMYDRRGWWSLGQDRAERFAL